MGGERGLALAHSLVGGKSAAWSTGCGLVSGRLTEAG